MKNHKLFVNNVEIESFSLFTEHHSISIYVCHIECLFNLLAKNLFIREKYIFNKCIVLLTKYIDIYRHRYRGGGCNIFTYIYIYSYCYLQKIQRRRRLQYIDIYLYIFILLLTKDIEEEKEVTIYQKSETPVCRSCSCSSNLQIGKLGQIATQILFFSSKCITSVRCSLNGQLAILPNPSIQLIAPLYYIHPWRVILIYIFSCPEQQNSLIDIFYIFFLLQF